jgi:indolepyruvate ferredoxin oxidoreductase alpha subunit
MTGMQEHPATGYTLQGEKTKELDFIALASALGIESVHVIDPYDLKTTRTVLQEELLKSGPSVVISRRACVLFKRREKDERKPLKVNADTCVGCKTCVSLGCPPISWKKFEDTDNRESKRRSKKQKGVSFIDDSLCTGCTVCQQVCKIGAIVEVD